MPKQDKKKKLYPTAHSPEMWTYIESLPARYNDKTELGARCQVRHQQQGLGPAEEIIPQRPMGRKE